MNEISLFICDEIQDTGCWMPRIIRWERPPASIIAAESRSHKNLSRLPRPMAALTLEPAFLIQHLVSRIVRFRFLSR
jgi:hypothetical protein